MKKILLSVAGIVVIAGAVTGATIAFYNDTETSTGNIFVAGSVDLKVDHTYASYNGVDCVGNCNPTGPQLIVNGGFETPVVTDNGGQWQQYPNGLLTNWNVTSGSGLELQRNSVAGAPHGGVQLAELDSDQPNSQSAIEQVVNTVPGQKYRLTFWHSPRPNNGPAGDNKVAFTVRVTSTNGIMINDTVENTSVGGGSTLWTLYTYNFIALDTQTTIQFGDAGTQADTLGGYLDDVSLFALNCSPQNLSFPNGGICSVWGEKDLGPGDTFWNFPDIKPGDYGTNVLSLHVYDNDSFVCLLPSNIQDDENTAVEPELTALPVNDTPANGIQNGELSDELEFFIWKDVDGDNTFDLTEQILVDAGTPFNQIPIQMVALSLTGNAPISLVGMSWCAGDQTGPTIALPNTALACDGNGMGDIAQTDKMISDFVAYAVQQRNNLDFDCEDVDIPLFTPVP